MAKTYQVDRVMAEWLIVGLIAFALFVEVILHKLEHWIQHKHAHLSAVLRNLYREIMILGMVSFGFILYIFIENPSGGIKLTFEVAHIFIFLFACFHTFVVMCTIFISLRLSQRWKSLERMELVKYLEKKEKYSKLCDRLERKRGRLWRYFAWWFPKVSRPFKYWKLHEVMAFHDIRFQFIYFRNLPMDFRFSSFLRKIKANTFIELVEIHWSHWVFFLAITLLDIGRVEAGWYWMPYFEPALLIAESAVNMFLVTLLGGKIRKIYWRMTRNPATYYDQVDRHSLEKERIIEDEVKKMITESRPQSRRVSRTFERNRTPVSQDESPPREDDGTVMRKSVEMDRPRASRDRSRRPSQSSAHPPGQASSSGAAAHHKPIYQNLAYHPPKSLPSPGNRTPSAHHSEDGLVLEDVVARHSLDTKREGGGESSDFSQNADKLSARSEFDKPRKYEPSPSLTNKDGSIAMDAVAAAAQRRRLEGRTSVETAGRFSRTSQDNPLGNRPDRPRRDSNASRRTSVDMSGTLPVEDINRRSSHSREFKTKKNGHTVVDLRDEAELDMDPSEMRKLAMKRLAEKKKPTPGLITHANANAEARAAEVDSKLPSWLVKRFPRLGRVASPAEKLFWFGSPKYYLWCVEWVLFFTTLNISATLAKVGTATKKRLTNKENAKKAAATVRMLVDGAVRQASTKKTATGSKALPITDDNYNLLIVALVVAVIALGYVLIRIADIMKKYIFVLNNANMIPETMTIEAIQTVRVKDLMHGNKAEYEPVYDNGSDTELEDGEYAQTRRNMSTFFKSEVQSGGNIPGTEAPLEGRNVSVSSRRSSDQVDAVAEWDGKGDNV